MQNILDKIGEIAEKEKIKVYLVGGPVRDFIMKNEIKDIDICVEGNGISFAKILKKYFNCGLKTYSEFNTATLFLAHFSIDIATSRKETYPYPTSLPVVENGDIFTDLARRDFTINSIALSLDKKRGFIDPFSGRDDIKKGLVRVLHKKSFIDDPTRIFRAIRFKQRFDFRLEKETKKLLKQSIRIINKLSPERIRTEIMLLLKEQKKEEIFSQLYKLGVLDIIKLKPPQPGVSTSLFALIDPDKMPDFLTKSERQIAQGILKISLKEDLLKKAEKPSQIYQILFGIPEESLVFRMNQKPVIKGKIKEFLNVYNKVKLEITGRDLEKLGIKKGPIYKELLTKTLLAKLDGKIKGKQVHLVEEEINFVKTLLIHFFLDIR